MTESLGWLATTVFVSSYFFRNAEALRAMQVMGAVLWIVYGVLIGASPVVVANLLVGGAAGWTVIRARRAGGGKGRPAADG